MNDTTNSTVLSCQDLCKAYHQGGERQQVLDNLNLHVKQGETIALTGESGSGKTTLLNILAGLDDADSGSVLVAGEDLTRMKAKQRTKLRNHTMGFVHQFHHLLGEFSALENIAMPLLIRSDSVANIRKRSLELLQQVGLSARANNRPAELSGGERQRVAIARALVASPLFVLMDEPTGNLDKENSKRFLELLTELNDTTGVSFVVVTHSEWLADGMQRRLRLFDGQLLE